MSAVWGVAVILERFFENTHIVHPQNIGENGRIVIDKGRKEIFFLFLLHYTEHEKFLDTVNSCSGKVNMLCPDGKKQNINGEEKIQGSLWRQYSQNKNCLRLVLEVPNPTDYMNIVSYYAGDC